MRLSPAHLDGLADLAIAAATQAGQMIADSRPREIEFKASGSSLASRIVTEIDTRSQDIILDLLTPTLERFELGLLTEEQEDDGGRLATDYFWCIDPLDGTLPFTEGVHGYAVSIALVGQDGVPCIGVVYDPVEQTLMHAVSGVGAFRDRVHWRLAPEASRNVLSVFADRSLLQRDDYGGITDALGAIAEEVGLEGAQLHATGGAVMNVCRVLANAPACYFKYPGPTGGGSLWDFAATACLFHEVGAIATDITGGPLDLNRADSTLMNHRGVLFATDVFLARRVRALYQNASS